VPDAIRTTIAIASDPYLSQKIESRAADLVEEWFRRYGAAITHLPASEQTKFDRIKQQSERPLPTTIVLPRRQTGEARGHAWEKHLLCAGDGLYRADFADWEEHVLTTELNAGVVAWYRNPARGKRGLQIPYETSGWWSGLAPDFIFVNLVGGALVASIIDPHGTHFADAAPKLKGLAAYAEEHAHQFHRIQSVAKIDGSYLMLNHLKDDVRAAIKGFNGTDAADLFRRHGINY
jgi:type III restriction enzyme